MKFLHIIDKITNRQYRYSFDAICIHILGDMLHVYYRGNHDTFNLKTHICEVYGT